MAARGRVAGVAAVVAAVGLVVALLAWPRPAEASYVTAPASRGTITETTTLVGRVERAGQATVSYTTPGLVTAVLVRVGDSVSAGQQLVTIDDGPLRVAVLQARAQLAQAEAQLDADLAAQRSGASRTATGLGSLPTSGAAAPPAAPPGAGSTTPPAYLTAMNASLTNLQTAASAQMTQCAPVFAALQRLRDLQVPTHPVRTPTPSASGTPSPSASAAVTPSVTPSETPSVSESVTPSVTPTVPATPSASVTATASFTPGPTASGAPHPSLPDAVDKLVGMVDQVTACTTAMGALAEAEGRAGAAIAAAAQGLAEQTRAAQLALAQAQAELQKAAQQASEAAVRAAQAQLEQQLASSFGGAVTEATIASDRARLVDARQRVDTAEANLAAIHLTSPVSGVVGALGFVVGESTAGRSATIVGDGAAVVDVEVPLSQRAKVARGTRAGVGQIASREALPGQVTEVSILSTSSGGQPTYTTRVVADDPGGKLRPGSFAQVTLVLGEVTDVLTVPASAITRITDTTANVEVVTDPLADTARTVAVVTGRTGTGRVEIVSGLASGDLVVLADRRLPVPGGLGQYAPARTATPTPAR